MTDVFRREYTPLTEEQKARVASVKDAAQDVYDLIDGVDGSDLRCIAVAKTKLEEAVMWAVKGLTNK